MRHTPSPQSPRHCPRRAAAVPVAVLVAALALGGAALPPAAEAQWLVLDAANLYQQIVQYAQMLLDYYQQYAMLVQEVEQLQNLVEQVELMGRNLEHLDHLGADNPSRVIDALRALLGQLGGIVYTADDLLRRYDEVYAARTADDLPIEEAERTEQTLETFRALLGAAHQHAVQTEASSHTLGALTRQLDAADGNVQALQAVGALTTQVATETSRLNEVSAATLNALVVHYSNQLASREQARKTFLDWVSRGRVSRPAPAQSFEPVPPVYSARGEG